MGKSTNTDITEFLKYVYDSVDRKETRPTIALFLDLSKAFDIIDHDILLKKLQACGIRGNALNWFKSYLENRKQVVEITYIDNKTGIINNKLSSEKPINYCV